MYFYGFTVWDLVLILPALLFVMYAQMKVKSTYGRFSQMHSARGLTGAQVARQILDDNGLYDVPVEHISGQLTDHFDPRSRVVRLSDGVYGSDSIAAIGVAAHECGHAVQYQQNYSPMRLRAAIIPITNIGSTLAIPLVLIGYVMSIQPLVTIGIVGFSAVALFQLVTLPVEFDASARAMRTIREKGILYDSEAAGARKVLSAAAMTYVAALLTAVAQLLRLILVFGNRNNRN